MPDLATYNALAAIADPAERLAASEVDAAFRALDASAGVVAALEACAARLGMPYRTVRNKYYAWRKSGPAALADGRKRGKAPARSKWEAEFLRRCEDDTNTSMNAWRGMMADFRAGKVLQGIGDWRACWMAERPFEAVPAECPPDFVPQGATYANLMRASKRNPDLLFSIAVNRQGRRAAHRFLLPVLKSRAGLPVGAVTQWDDVWHNTDVLVAGSAKAVQPLEFAGYDYASGFKRASLVKPRLVRADGTRENLSEQMFRFLFAFDHIATGFHRGGVTDVIEHGTTAIREPVERRIKSIPGFGALIALRRSGILSEQAHAGLAIGCGGGNFRMKALVEQGHNAMHDRLASLPGSRGRDAEHLRESQPAMVKYEERLLAAAARIDPRAAAMLQAGLMSFDEYNSAFRAIEAALMDDPEHRLEGWEGKDVREYRFGASSPWLPASGILDMAPDQAAAIGAYLAAHPEDRRIRPMSRREAWSAGAADLVRVPKWEMPYFLDPDKDFREAVVRDDGLVGISDRFWFGRDELLYRAAVKTREGYVQAVPPRTRVMACFNPLMPEALWLVSREDGRLLGMAPQYSRAPQYDRVAVLEAMGAQARDLAAKLMPVRGRHQAQAEERVARIAANEAVLAAAKNGAPSAAGAPAGRLGAARPASLDEISGAGDAGAAPCPGTEDDGADAAGFLAGITTAQDKEE